MRHISLSVTDTVRTRHSESIAIQCVVFVWRRSNESLLFRTSQPRYDLVECKIFLIYIQQKYLYLSLSLSHSSSILTCSMNSYARKRNSLERARAVGSIESCKQQQAPWSWLVAAIIDRRKIIKRDRIFLILNRAQKMCHRKTNVRNAMSCSLSE